MEINPQSQSAPLTAAQYNASTPGRTQTPPPHHPSHPTATNTTLISASTSATPVVPVEAGILLLRSTSPDQSRSWSWAWAWSGSPGLCRSRNPCLRIRRIRFVLPRLPFGLLRPWGSLGIVRSSMTCRSVVFLGAVVVSESFLL